MTRNEHPSIFEALVAAIIVVMFLIIIIILWSDHRLIAWLARDIQMDWTP